MDGLEDLRPFIWLCQICGFFPYRMEVDAVTKRFKRFTFSYIHPITIWCFSLQLYHLVSYVNSFTVSMHLEQGIPTHGSQILRMFLCLSEYLDNFVLWAVVYRLWLISKALEISGEMDQSLPTIRLKIAVRTYMAIAYVLLSVKQLDESH